MSATKSRTRARRRAVPVGRAVQRHRVREGVLAQIRAGELTPGSKLGQAQLAQDYGVSRIVVREALMELQGTGLVEATDNCGVRVTALDERRVREACELRELIEVFAVRRCCDTCTLRDLRELRAQVAEMVAAHAAGNTARGAQLDREFHLRLVQLAGNGLLQRLTEDHWFLGKMLYAEQPNLAVLKRSHLAIVAAIAAGDPDRAEAALRAHLQPPPALLARLAAGDLRVVNPRIRP